MREFLNAYLSRIDKSTLRPQDLQDLVLSTAAHLRRMSPKIKFEYVTGSGVIVDPVSGLIRYNLCWIAQSISRNSNTTCTLSPCYFDPISEYSSLTIEEAQNLPFDLISCGIFTNFSMVQGWYHDSVCIMEHAIATELGLEIQEIRLL